MSDPTKAADRALGLALALSGGIAFFAIRSYFHRREGLTSHFPPGSDELHTVRYALLEKLSHGGSCHCQRIQFRIRAPRIINAFDMQSKVRYPRLVIKCEDFENMSDENHLSLYAVTNGNNVGIHAFCSYCGVHILFSPAEDPKEIQINVDCLDRSNIEKVNVAYYGKNETIPCDLSDMKAQLYTRTRNPSTITVDGGNVPPPMSRTPSRSLAHDMQIPHGAINDSDYCSESMSELIVEGLDDIDSEKEFSRGPIFPEERRETTLHMHTPGSIRYHPQYSGLPSGSDWEREVNLYNSWNSHTWRHHDSSNSPTMSNSYTTTESLSGNDFHSKDERKDLGRSQSSWNAVGIETPTAALHRRLKTFLRRHMPQDRPTTSAIAPTRLEQQYEAYDTSRWRR